MPAYVSTNQRYCEALRFFQLLLDSLSVKFSIYFVTTLCKDLVRVRQRKHLVRIWRRSYFGYFCYSVFIGLINDSLTNNNVSGFLRGLFLSCTFGSMIHACYCCVIVKILAKTPQLSQMEIHACLMSTSPLYNTVLNHVDTFHSVL